MGLGDGVCSVGDYEFRLRVHLHFWGACMYDIPQTPELVAAWQFAYSLALHALLSSVCILATRELTPTQKQIFIPQLFTLTTLQRLRVKSWISTALDPHNTDALFLPRLTMRPDPIHL